MIRSITLALLAATVLTPATIAQVDLDEDELVRLPGQGEVRGNALRDKTKAKRLKPGGGLFVTFDTDANGRILYTNARLEALFGYSRDELISQSIELLIPERFRALHVQHRQTYMEQPHIRPMGTGMDLAGRRKDGREFPIEAGLSLMPDEDIPRVD